jgi:hypothetical protein
MVELSTQLKPLVDKSILKIKKGYFNVLIIFGPTRTGKTTLAARIGKYMADKLGVEFNVNHIFFKAEDLLDAAEGKKRGVFQLDEAAFNLKGAEHMAVEQRNFVKYFDTAAKYNQTFLIIIPYVEELKKRFIRDEHTRGIEVCYNKKTLDRGYFKAYNNHELVGVYEELKKGNYTKAAKCPYSAFGMFGDDMSFINEEIYQANKDNAIKSITSISNTGTSRKTYIIKALQNDITQVMCAKIFGTAQQNISKVWRDFMEQNPDYKNKNV